MRSRTVRRYAVLIALVTASGCGRFESTSPRQEPTPAAPPQQGLEAQSSLRCSPGESVGHYEGFIGEDAPAGPSSPIQAVGELLSEEGNPPEQNLVVAASSETATQVVAERSGARVVSAYVELHGDSWYVTQLFACSHALSASETDDA